MAPSPGGSGSAGRPAGLRQHESGEWLVYLVGGAPVPNGRGRRAAGAGGLGPGWSPVAAVGSWASFAGPGGRTRPGTTRLPAVAVPGRGVPPGRPAAAPGRGAAVGLATDLPRRPAGRADPAGRPVRGRRRAGPSVDAAGSCSGSSRSRGRVGVRRLSRATGARATARVPLPNSVRPRGPWWRSGAWSPGRPHPGLGQTRRLPVPPALDERRSRPARTRCGSGAAGAPRSRCWSDAAAVRRPASPRCESSGWSMTCSTATGRGRRRGRPAGSARAAVAGRRPDREHPARPARAGDLPRGRGHHGAGHARRLRELPGVNGPWAGWLSRMDFGVALFFLLSGLLLFRPSSRPAWLRRTRWTSGTTCAGGCCGSSPACWSRWPSPPLVLPNRGRAGAAPGSRHALLVQNYFTWPAVPDRRAGPALEPVRRDELLLGAAGARAGWRSAGGGARDQPTACPVLLGMFAVARSPGR